MIKNTIEFIQEEWKKDVIIDKNHLEYAELQNGILHSKYIDMLVEYKRELIFLEREFNKLKNLKTQYYKGKLSREKLTELGWEPYQFIISKSSELMDTLLLDKDINDFNIKIQDINIGIELIQSILDKIKNRSWQIKNIIEIKKFNAGF